MDLATSLKINLERILSLKINKLNINWFIQFGLHFQVPTIGQLALYQFGTKKLTWLLKNNELPRRKAIQKQHVRKGKLQKCTLPFTGFFTSEPWKDIGNEISNKSNQIYKLIINKPKFLKKNCITILLHEDHWDDQQ